MAVAFVSKGTSANNASSASVILNKPSTVTSGDALVAVFVVRSTSSSVSTVPTGWTLVIAQLGTNVDLRAYTKLATGAEPSTYTWSLAVAAGWSGGTLDYSGVDTTTAPFTDGTPASQTGSNTTSFVCPSITTATDGSMVIGAAACLSAATFTSAGLTERFDVNQELGAGTCVAGDVLKSPAGSTGTFTETSSLKTAYASLTFALLATVAGGGAGIPDLAMAPLGRAA